MVQQDYMHKEAAYYRSVSAVEYKPERIRPISKANTSTVWVYGQRRGSVNRISGKMAEI